MSRMLCPVYDLKWSCNCNSRQTTNYNQYSNPHIFQEIISIEGSYSSCKWWQFSWRQIYSLWQNIEATDGEAPTSSSTLEAVSTSRFQTIVRKWSSELKMNAPLRISSVWWTTVQHMLRWNPNGWGELRWFIGRIGCIYACVVWASGLWPT